MTDCRHRKLVALETKSTERRRCRHCHLTIAADELGGSYCPECFEATGRKRYEFEAVASPASTVVRYRCEDCGAMMGADSEG